MKLSSLPDWTTKSTRNGPVVSPALFIAAVALVYTLVFYGITIFPFEFTPEHSTVALWRMTHAFSNVVLMLLVLALFQWLFLIGVPLLFVASVLIAFFRFRYNITLNTNIIGALIETDPSEASAFISTELTLLVLVALICGAGVAWVYRRYCWQPFDFKRDGMRAYLRYAFVIAFVFALRYAEELGTPSFENQWFAPTAIGIGALLLLRPLRTRPTLTTVFCWCAFATIAVLALLYGSSQEKFWTVTTAIACAVAATLGGKFAAQRAVALAIFITPALSMPEQTETFLPTNAVYATAYHVIDRLYMRDSMRDRDDIGRYAAEIDDNTARDLVVVLVIGESARGAQFGVNGYERDTTPLLTKLHRDGELISFRSARSCAAATRVSVPCLMTRATEMAYTPAYTETSLISVLAARGFDTTWISTNQIFGRHDSPITVIANEARTREFQKTIDDIVAGAHDGSMIEPLRKKLAAGGRQLIVLHQRGSHWHYADRYPKEFERWTPACPNTTTPSQCEIPALVNAYDNTILYTDHVLHEVIASLRDQNALMLYVSDHGQSLGEDEYFTHGSPERAEQRDIPFMVWASERFRSLHKDVIPTLKKREKHNDKVSHDNVFHTLLGCIGLQSGLVDEELNLCATPVSR